MGSPQNYSLELPARCLKLIDELWDQAAYVRPETRPELGALTSTFLLSMSIPIINQPIERIDKTGGNQQRVYLSDRKVNGAVVNAFKKMKRDKFKQAPFYQPMTWSFVKRAAVDKPDLAKGLPIDLARLLGDEEAFLAASELDGEKWSAVIRNALAHSGVFYLNRDGFSSYADPAAMYCFVSGSFGKAASLNEPGPLIAVNFLRISQRNYRRFLQLWVQWLSDTGIASAAEAA